MKDRIATTAKCIVSGIVAELHSGAVVAPPAILDRAALLALRPFCKYQSCCICGFNSSAIGAERLIRVLPIDCRISAGTAPVISTGAVMVGKFASRLIVPDNRIVSRPLPGSQPPTDVSVLAERIALGKLHVAV